MPETPSWTLIGASVVGSSHRLLGRGCDDAHWFGTFRSGAAIAVVADGLGSASQSSLGASFIARTVGELLTGQQGQVTSTSIGPILRAVINNAVAQLQVFAGKSDLRDFSSTLLCLWVDDNFVAGVNIGDGFAVTWHSDGSIDAGSTSILQCSFPPERSEYANETRSVHEAATANCIEPVVLHTAIDAFCLSTDGMLRLALKHNLDPFEPFFAKLLLSAEKCPESEGNRLLGEFLDSSTVNSKTEDDKTLVIGIRRPQLTFE